MAPEASIYAVKVLKSSGSGYTSDVIRGIEWVIANDMDIISMSLGGTCGNNAYKAAMDNACNSGLILIAPAGNYGSNADDNVAFPAKYDSVITVSAIDQNDNICSFSSVGPAVELAAPDLWITTTDLGGDYQYFSETSAATPFGSGVAALIMASDPTLSNVEVRQQMQLNAIDPGTQVKDNEFGYGIPIPVLDIHSLNAGITIELNPVESGQNA